MKEQIVANILLVKEAFNAKIIFSLIFILLGLYYLVIKEELYESKAALVVRDLSSSSQTATLGISLLGAGSSSQLQDSMVVQEYLLSLDMFTLLDKAFNLKGHYKSSQLDLIERLPADATAEEVLEFYRERLLINYDEISGILHLAYAHTDPQIAQKILRFMIKGVEYELNEFNRRKAKKQLKFIEIEHEKNKEKMDKSSAVLEEYQNSQLLLDPTSKATSSSAIIAGLESSLTQKQIEYKTKNSYLNSKNYELVSLNTEIQEIKKSLARAKERLTGKGEERLNKILFEYDKLKMQVEFDTEVYKNALLQLETIKLDALKEAKTLSIVSKPNLPDGYTYPNKPKVFITLLIIILLTYGIFSMINAIIKDHKE